MRALGLVGILLALLVVAWVAKDQLSVTQARLPQVPGTTVDHHAASVRDRATQIEDQYRNAVQGAMKKEQKRLKDSTQ